MNKKEILKRIEELLVDVKGTIYRTMIESEGFNVDEFTFEIAIQANDSPSHNSTVRLAGEELVALAQMLYPNAKMGDEYLINKSY